MFNKDSLKNKKYNVIAVLMSALLAAGILIGCGTKAEDPGGGTEAVAESVEPVTVESSETADEKEPVTEDVKTDEVDNNDTEDILSREKPTVYYENQDGQKFKKDIPTNQFLLIEEVADPTEDKNYVAVKGTLYEVFLDGEPDYDLVYFPGDKLPEGYEVKVTEDYEVALADASYHGEGHSYILGMAYLAKKDLFNKISYKSYLECCKITCDIDPTVSFSDSDWEGPAVEPGMYGSLALDLTDTKYHSPESLFVQYLLKDQIPEGVELDDNIVHQ